MTDEPRATGTVGLHLGVEVVRGYGDFRGEYEAVVNSVGLLDRTDLLCGRMWGRDPARMLNGLITNDLGGLSESMAVYGAMLTPKGRVITDLITFSSGVEGDAELGFVMPATARDAVAAHLRKYVPPMFAKWEFVADCRIAGLYGPRSASVLSEVFGTEPMADRDRLTRPTGHPGVVIIGSAISPGFEILLPAADASNMLERLRDAVAGKGGREVGFDALETVRIEQGIPRLGAEITDETLPAEVYLPTGQMDRAISFSKGCYTGQEVVVRIAHRGHVNRRIQGLELSGVERPQVGDALFSQGRDKSMGEVTSVAESPRLGRIGLGSVRREIDSGGEVCVGEPDGPPAVVRELPFSPAS